MHDELMPFRSPDAVLPLTPISFEILLALSEGDRHGYAILQQVESRTAGLLPLRTGTLYRALARLEETGLIAASEVLDDERRRYYRITPRGREIAGDEAKRMEDQVAAARSRKLLGSSER
jgi:DNA-binding PadR family transcriptional regulator